MAYSFFTIGHSTRTVSQFVDLLQASQIEFVVDVRHIPRSRTNPQFNRETLAEELATGSCSFLLSAGAPFLDIDSQSIIISAVACKAACAATKDGRRPMLLS